MAKKILFLVVYKHWFDLMYSGVKKYEYRKKSKWILSRLENKTYDQIRFSNGYGKNKPFFICEYNGYVITEKKETIKIKDYEITVQVGDVIIKLGKIISKGNF